MVTVAICGLGLSVENNVQATEIDAIQYLEGRGINTRHIVANGVWLRRGAPWMQGHSDIMGWLEIGTQVNLNHVVHQLHNPHIRWANVTILSGPNTGLRGYVHGIYLNFLF